MSSIPKLHILVGIPGCGKSSFAPRLTGNIISTDALREELAKDPSDQSKNGLVFKVFHNMLRFGLDLRHDMVADSTALRQQDRKELYKVALGSGAESHVYLFTNTWQAVRRNFERERRVPYDVMENMLSKYERTLLELPDEREFFSSLITVGKVL